MAHPLAPDAKAAELLRYRTMVEHAAEGVCVGQGGAIRFANAQCLALLGVDAARVAGRPMIEYVHPQDRAFVTSQRDRRSRGEVVPPFEARFQRDDGQVSWVEINGVVIDWDGAPANLFFLKDVSERKRMEEDTRVAAERYRAVVQNVNESIFVAQEGVIRFANESAKAMFRSPLVDVPSIHLIHPEDRALVMRQRELMVSGRLVEPYEARFITPPGESMGEEADWGWASIYGVRIEWDGRSALLILMSDTSERRALHEKLKGALAQERELGEQKTRFVATAAHEFRTPLAAILSAAELMEHYGEKIEPEERQRMMAELVASARRIDVVLKDMLHAMESPPDGTGATPEDARAP